MNARKAARITAAVLAAVLILYAAAVYIIDPYMHYHAPWFGLEPQRSDDSRYENYGIARFFDYDAVMLGTSVTQDAKASEYEALYDCTAIRIKFAGSYFKELGDFLKYAYENHEGIDRVFWVLDLTHFLTEADKVGHTDNPEYLYDDNFFNDASYLLNKDVLPNMARALVNYSPVDFDWQVWNDPTGYDTLVSMYGPNRPEQQEAKEFDEAMRDMVLENFESNILSIVRAHPETEFTFVYPPGNAFFWDYVTRYGEYDCYIDAMELAAENILALPNTRLFSYADDDGKVRDLDRFKDRVHFDPAMMSEIIADTAAGKGEITLDTLADRMASLREYWRAPDYEKLYAGLDPWVQ